MPVKETSASATLHHVQLPLLDTDMAADQQQTNNANAAGGGRIPLSESEMSTASTSTTAAAAAAAMAAMNDLMLRQLGDLALKQLNMGEPVKDEIIVHIIVEKIRTLPKDKGWMLDGFPATLEQARLLEKALTGYDENHPEPVRPKADSVLAPNPKPTPPKPKHKSSIDLVVYLDISTDSVLERAAGRYGECLSCSSHLKKKKLQNGVFCFQKWAP